MEIRQYLRRLTIEDVRKGMQPVRLTGPDGTTQVYAPPVLQYRNRERVMIDGEQVLQWSAWADAQVVREGIEDVYANLMGMNDAQMEVKS